MNSIKVLIVEDEAILRQAYRSILKQEGFDVHEAADGQAALGLLPRVKPDVIVLDILMPKMDGLAFLEAAHLAKDYPHTKVLAFSNLSDQQKLAKIVALGVAKQVLKSSLSPKQLVETIRQLIDTDKPAN